MRLAPKHDKQKTMIPLSKLYTCEKVVRIHPRMNCPGDILPDISLFGTETGIWTTYFQSTILENKCHTFCYTSQHCRWYIGMTYSLTSLHSGANDADMLLVVEQVEDSPPWKARKDSDEVYDAARKYVNPCRLRSSTARVFVKATPDCFNPMLRTNLPDT